mmetsp:Transcript_17102/g.48668  ORF Transcript_17102/g.48668 Transcript_17102/m.48668 type:complete len:244 (-) Transcript_17102:24-755(-)
MWRRRKCEAATISLLMGGSSTAPGEARHDVDLWSLLERAVDLGPDAAGRPHADAGPEAVAEAVRGRIGHLLAEAAQHAGGAPPARPPSGVLLRGAGGHLSTAARHGSLLPHGDTKTQVSLPAVAGVPQPQLAVEPVGEDELALQVGPAEDVVWFWPTVPVVNRESELVAGHITRDLLHVVPPGLQGLLDVLGLESQVVLACYLALTVRVGQAHPVGLPQAPGTHDADCDGTRHRLVPAARCPG